jgi:AcrR family transcriptional regulator
MAVTKSSRKQKPRGPGRLSAEATAELEDRLLDAAEAIFLDQGFASATVDAIARTANVTRKTLYARYVDKRDILAAVIARVIDRSISVPHLKQPSAGDAREQLMQLAQGLVAFVSSPVTAGLSRLVFAEGHKTPELIPVLNDLYDREIATVEAALASLKDQGALPRLRDTRLDAVIFIEMVSSTARMRGMLGPAAAMPRKRADAYVAEAVDLFLRGCGRAL